VSATLALRFTRLTPDRHRFEYRRADGTGETIEVESDGVLAHDLLHYAVESEAGLKGSFYGILAKIGGYEELSVAGGAALGGEIAITEVVVGALRDSLAEDVFDPDDLVARIADDLALFDHRPPRWLTAIFAMAARTRARELLRRWEATPFGAALELSFET
jgi:hypothetical protein